MNPTNKITEESKRGLLYIQMRGKGKKCRNWWDSFCGYSWWVLLLVFFFFFIMMQGFWVFLWMRDVSEDFLVFLQEKFEILEARWVEWKRYPLIKRGGMRGSFALHFTGKFPFFFFYRFCSQPACVLRVRIRMPKTWYPIHCEAYDNSNYSWFFLSVFTVNFQILHESVAPNY